jgi:hypothetical protein
LTTIDSITYKKSTEMNKMGLPEKAGRSKTRLTISTATPLVSLKRLALVIKARPIPINHPLRAVSSNSADQNILICYNEEPYTKEENTFETKKRTCIIYQA